MNAARGFPAFPAGTRRSGRFARSWWGMAWLRAIEETALDPQPLKEGRRYALRGRVGPITVSPGEIAATVEDEHDIPYRTRVLVERLTDAQWDRFLTEAVARAGHLAALLDRDMPRDLVTAAEDAGVPLLPALGDLQPECDCPDWEYPCRHAAALCYQVAWLLDEDPFVLLLMRGRGADELRRELQQRIAAGAIGPGGLAAEVGAAGADGSAGVWAYPPQADPLPPFEPSLLAGPVDTGRLRALPAAPGVDPEALARLAVHAANRARRLLGAFTDHSGPDGDATATAGRDD